jgi:hypothetical protein
MTEEGEESLEVSRGGDELETSNTSDDSQVEPLISLDPLDQSKPAPFEFISENIYITERVASKEGKRNKRMMCDCQFDPGNSHFIYFCLRVKILANVYFNPQYLFSPKATFLCYQQ